MSRKSAHLLRHSDTSASDGSMPRKEYTDISCVAASKVLHRMYLHFFHEKPTHMTDNDHHEVCPNRG